MPVSFQELNIPIGLNTSKNDLIAEFFTPILKTSVKYDRGVGYFSSSWIKENLAGMSEFANNGGRARWITSPILSKSDWEAMYIGDLAKQDEVLKFSIEQSIRQMQDRLENSTLALLAWMISDGVIEFKLAKPRNKLTEEYHSKIGIFGDAHGNSISFDGSYNDSSRGLQNVESIKVFKSWDFSAEWVRQEQDFFDKTWQNEDPNIQVFSLPEASKARILKLRELEERPYPAPSWLRLNRMAATDIPAEPSLPSIPEEVQLREYQLEAVQKWVSNNYHGILEMATGTGKTFAALSAAATLFQQKGRLLVIVICPYLHLVQQWAEEMRAFGMTPIIAAEAQKRWVPLLHSRLRDFQHGHLEFSSIVVTEATFRKEEFQRAIEEYGIHKNALIIADETHHYGTKEMLKRLSEEVPFRLGLSATPLRQYDTEGTEALLAYFGGIVFSLPIEDAIVKGYLTPYSYYPIPVNLTEDEFFEFAELTRKLTRLFPKDDEPLSEAGLMIAIKRARILNNSKAKLDWLTANISNEATKDFTLFYSGEKSFKEVTRILGLKKRIPIHEFTHRQSLIERKEIIKAFGAAEYKALVAMKCLDEGVDIPPTRIAYFLASSSVHREFAQRRGRILRLHSGKKQAEIHDLVALPPQSVIRAGKRGEYYSTVRSALKREYRRITEFASVAQNKFQALDKLTKLLDMFDLLDQ